MWHHFMIYMDSISDFAFWSLTILLMIAAWFGIDWLADWLDGRSARARAVRQQREAAAGRALPEQDRADIRARLRADVQGRRHQTGIQGIDRGGYGKSQSAASARPTAGRTVAQSGIGPDAA